MKTFFPLVKKELEFRLYFQQFNISLLSVTVEVSFKFPWKFVAIRYRLYSTCYNLEMLEKREQVIFVMGILQEGAILMKLD